MVRHFVLTQHVQERFVQRTNKRFHHLQDCHHVNCPECEKLLTEIRQVLKRDRVGWTHKILTNLREAQECRWFLNNSEFMSRYYDKYGYDKRFEFLVYDGILFVAVLEEGKRIVVTCVLAKTHIAGRPSLRPKFNHLKDQRIA